MYEFCKDFLHVNQHFPPHFIFLWILQQQKLISHNIRQLSWYTTHKWIDMNEQWDVNNKVHVRQGSRTRLTAHTRFDITQCLLLLCSSFNLLSSEVLRNFWWQIKQTFIVELHNLIFTCSFQILNMTITKVLDNINIWQRITVFFLSTKTTKQLLVLKYQEIYNPMKI